ncbi:MAG TPA: glycoside hydrolase family 15 protein [Ktedonobacterales bacterium]|nr:glycoside hydrolase family 15 protein [Ktedonobacterales bacterium]
MRRTEQVTASVASGEEPRYRAISDYGVIGDCRTAALIGPDGSIDWCCLPHFDSPAIFCRLLDADQGGFFRLHLSEGAQATMVYQPGTNILETTFAGPSGKLRLVDFMPIRKRRPSAHPVRHMGVALLSRVSQGLASAIERDMGNDVAAAHRLQRMATCLEGSVEVELTLKATFDYARQSAVIELIHLANDAVGALLWAGDRYLALLVRRIVASAHDHAAEAPLALEQADHTLHLRAPLQAGDQLIAALNYARDRAEAQRLLGQLARHPFARDLEETQRYWLDWSKQCRYDGPYQQAVRRSSLALKLCTFEPTGAIVAAPTTSLPEWVGGVRNWDYRYTWLRDSAFTLAALANLGYYEEARNYFHFLHDLHLQRIDDVRIMYSIRGETDGLLDEHMLDHLEGYQGSRPVRIGNGAALQRQLDIYGELLDTGYTYLRHEGFRLPSFISGCRDLWSFCSMVADYVIDHWQELDRGIWEVRGDPQAFVYSRVMCWVALDRACKLARHYQHHNHAARWEVSRDAIHQDILEHGYSEALQSFTQAYGNDALDAANLRLLLVKFLPPDSPLIHNTIEATLRTLAGAHGVVYRYRPAGSVASDDMVTDDGLPGREGAFLACAFWLIDNLCYLGRVDEARERFEGLLRWASPLGLFSEEVDPASGAQLGNYPQAFTHIGLINSAVTLQRAQEGVLVVHPQAATHTR